MADRQQDKTDYPKGISFDSKNNVLGTGVTLICSMNPFSFSLTIFREKGNHR